ncbi:MAG: flagellar hook-length control protein FliK [Pseudomonas sp.]|uniref:flagellar hook-length control protein FliK n=1 Tax=Pseudomonas sp. FEMGT703P TaxID=2080764 RepID=UPI000CB1CDF5|nr:flagellar hook-length control protein FliK [Pseudomonas sp. FEMGT703P]PJE41788.1 MAG: flagellar hook-length control protein FliK [Pseudomonas sp.] [Pseudomonas sp. FEMGT703P]
MSVAPDLLLKSAPEVKPRAAASKPPEKPAQPNKNEASSFSQVYAKERQAKAAERNDGPAKPARESNVDKDEPLDVQAPAAVGQAEVADSGKPLPTDPASDGAVLDPLLLLGITGEMPVAETDDVALEAEPVPLMVTTGNLTSSGPASMTEASFDAELDALNQLPAVRMALEMGAKEKLQADQAGAPSVQAQNVSQSLLASQVVQDETPVEGDSLELPELQLEALTGKSLEALKEGTANNAPENFVSKLNALTQAMNQQATQARAPLLAGQPVAMQQGGWSEAVVDRVMVMSSQNLKSAEIQLDPAELGRLEVRISVNQDQSQVTFASPHAGVREALDSQMHRLRELFAQQGMNQPDVNVSDQSLNRGWQGQGGDGGNSRGGSSSELLGGDEELHSSAVESARTSSVSARGLVDYYA